MEHTHKHSNGLVFIVLLGLIVTAQSSGMNFFSFSFFLAELYVTFYEEIERERQQKK